MKDLIPNFQNQLFVHTQNVEEGRALFHMHAHIGRLGSLAYNSFRWRAIRLFNTMPKYIRCICAFSVVSFKRKLDWYLKNIVDLPGRLGFSNSLESGDSQFKSVFTPQSGNTFPQLPGTQFPKIKPLHISENGVFMFPDRIDVSKSSGPDKLPGRLLQSLAKEITPVVYFLFTQSPTE